MFTIAGQVKTEEDLERERELRLENALKMLLFFDQGGKVVSEENLSDLLDIEAKLELQATQQYFQGQHATPLSFCLCLLE